MRKVEYVGVDYHPKFLAVVVLPEGVPFPDQKVKLENDPKKKMFMGKLPERYEIKACYEASSCGHVFQRQMREWQHSCQVVAPSMIPRKTGDRVKTDFKDVENLAYQFRNGSLTFVHVRTLRVLRWIGTLSAMILLAEIVDFKRFVSPKALMSFLGLTPSEYSSGGVKNYGGITKAGNGLCRRILIVGWGNKPQRKRGFSRPPCDLNSRSKIEGLLTDRITCGSDPRMAV